MSCGPGGIVGKYKRDLLIFSKSSNGVKHPQVGWANSGKSGRGLLKGRKQTLGGY